VERRQRRHYILWITDRKGSELLDFAIEGPLWDRWSIDY